MPACPEFLTNSNSIEVLTSSIKRLLGRFSVIACLAVTPASAHAGVEFVNDYPDMDAVDCSATYGIYSWCKGRPQSWLSLRGYGYRNCVDGASYWANKYTGVDPRGLGNANTWDDYATNYLVKPGNSNNIEPGDIAQSDDGYFGHVGFVTSVRRNPDGSIADIATAELNRGGMGEYSGPGTNIYSQRNSKGNFSRGGTNDWDHFIDLNGSGKGLGNESIAQSGRSIVGDWNNDGRTDISVFRPSDGGWHVRGIADHSYGQRGDWPVPGDYDGDGKIEAAVFRPNSGYWHIRAGRSIPYGQAGDIPVPADWNADGKTDVAIFRPSDGSWHIRGIADFAYGQTGDVPLVGDFDGNGRVEAAVYRPSNGYWHVRGGLSTPYGNSSDVPLPADYNGDGLTDLAVFRPSDGSWHVRRIADFHYGQNDDIPLIGDFDGNGLNEAAVFRPSTGLWHIRGNQSIAYGQSGDIPLTSAPNAAQIKLSF